MPVSARRLGRVLTVGLLALVGGHVGARAQSAYYSIQQLGDGKSGVGFAVRGVGDVNVDGWPDLLTTGYGVTGGFAQPPNALVVSGRDGHLLYAFDSDGEIATTYGGNRPAAAGDVNGDAYADFIIQGKSALGEGSLVISGRSGNVLLVLDTLVHDALGDLDVDGHEDIVGGSTDRVDVLSGADVHVIFHVPSDLTGNQAWFGYDVAAAGDANGDGTMDFAFRGWDEQDFGGKTFHLRMHSGADGSELWKQTERSATAFVPGTGNPTLARCGDLDGDGHDDLLVATLESAGSPQAVVVSGASGRILRRFFDPELASGGSVAGPGDLDGDHVPDVLLGTADAADALDFGRVTLFSGATGAILSSFQGFQPTHGFGGTLAALGDVTGDGIGDFVVGAGGSSQIVGAPRVHVVSGASLPVDDLAPGAGSPGISIGPVLTLRGRFDPGSVTMLTLTNGDPARAWWLVIGAGLLNPTEISAGPTPDVALPLVLDEYGSAKLLMRWPAPSPGGPVQLYLQARDATGADSNVLSVEF